MNRENPAEQNKYVLITPARNEEKFIERTIKTIVSQTLRPLKWVIVNDASTDKTREIIESFAKRYDFIQLINKERKGDRNFGAKAMAFAHGLKVVKDIDYGFIGNLDADISMGPDYYQSIILSFHANPKLGIAGGIVYTKVGNKFSTSDKTIDSVGGAVQLFRRACFEAVDGYVPLRMGGIDAAAEIKARMHGWEVMKFPEHRVFEHRRTGSAGASLLENRVREGRRFYSLGYDQVFYLLRCLYRSTDSPPIIGSIASLFGFVESRLRSMPILLPPDVVAFLRNEQRQRIKKLSLKIFRRGCQKDMKRVETN